LLFAYLCIDRSIAGKHMPTAVTRHQVIASSSQKSKAEEIFGQITVSFKRLAVGVTSVVPNGLRVIEIRKAYKNDPTSVSYFDWKKIGVFFEDLSKIVRLGVTIPISPELFVYSYVIAPMMAPSNPFAWSTLPSTFDIPADRAKREEMCIQRRFYGLTNILQVLRRQMIDDINEETKEIKTQTLNTFVAALHATSTAKSLEAISDWLFTEKVSKREVRDIRLQYVPGAIVKDFCRAIGVEGVPNIPIIRRLNNGEINRYCQKVIPT
jgi:hypothetical protein